MNSKHEFQARAVNMIRSIFEAHIQPGKTASELFEDAKRRALASLQKEIDVARGIDFDRFNRGYMPGVRPDTVFRQFAA